MVAEGQQIAYTVPRRTAPQADLGDGRRRSRPAQLTDAPNFSENPNWSPDGTRIVFDSDRVEKGDLDIYSVKADGSDIRRLTNSPALDALPAYSPDGKQDRRSSSDRLQKDSRRLFTMSATGAKPKRVVVGNEPNFQMVPDWQPLRLGVREKPLVPPGSTAAPKRRRGQGRPALRPVRRLVGEDGAGDHLPDQPVTPQGMCVDRRLPTRNALVLLPAGVSSIGSAAAISRSLPGMTAAARTAWSYRHHAGARRSSGTASRPRRARPDDQGPGHPAGQRREDRRIVVRHKHRCGRPLPLRRQQAEHRPGGPHPRRPASSSLSPTWTETRSPTRLRARHFERRSSGGPTCLR